MRISGRSRRRGLVIGSQPRVGSIAGGVEQSHKNTHSGETFRKSNYERSHWQSGHLVRRPRFKQFVWTGVAADEFMNEILPSVSLSLEVPFASLVGLGADRNTQRRLEAVRHA